MRASVVSLALAPLLALAATPSLQTINDTTWLLSNGDTFDMTINADGYAYSVQWNGRELVRNATGGYVDFGGRTTINYTQGPEVWEQTDSMLHINFPSYFADVHYILFSGLVGHFQYVVNNNLGEQGEVRALYRWDPLQFPRGRTNCKDDLLPNINDIFAGLNVQDETWRTRTGSYITKYDFSCFARETDYHGVYGDDVGAWYIAPSQDYYIGDQLKQELMVHRETKTDDAVMLHYFHGTHFMDDFTHNLPVGKMWGPWLLLINDGDQQGAYDRKCQEEAAWPYPWVNDTMYQSRATVKGSLRLSDGRPASGAAVFLGDEDCSETLTQGTTFQYTSYADDSGNFEFDNVRTEKGYCFVAWSNGGKLADVDGVFNGTQVPLNTSSESTYDMGPLTWSTSTREIAWQIGDFDRKTAGFKFGGDPAPYQHGLSDATPANLVYAIGTNVTSDWYYAQSAMGNWSVVFDPAPANRSAVLTLSFAGYTANSLNAPGLNVSMNAHLVGGVGQGRTPDKALYRSATTAGSYYQQQFSVPSELLLTDKFNQLDLSLTANSRWRGVMWDALKLEWE